MPQRTTQELSLPKHQSDSKKLRRSTGAIESHPADAISVEEFESIADVDRGDWDRMAGDSVLASHGLLRTIEETNITGHAARYFLARKNMEPVGAVVCHIEERSNEEGSVPIGGHRIDRMMLGRWAGLGRKSGAISLPCLMCGTQMGTRDPLILREGTATGEASQIAQALVRAMERTAKREGWTICFREVRREGSSLAAVLAQRGYLRGAELPTACLELNPQWRSFDDYRQHLKNTHPNTAKTIGNETNRGKKAGLTIELIDVPAPHRENLHALLDAHNWNHNSKPWPFRAEFFERVKDLLGERAVLYGAKLDGKWVGIAVVLQDAGDVIGSMIGIDAEANRSAAVYFNLAYNNLIREAIASGAQRVYYGVLLWDLKARRGCGPSEADFYLKSRNRLQNLLLRSLVGARSTKHDQISAPLRGRMSGQNSDAQE